MSKASLYILLVALTFASGQHIEHPDGRSENFNTRDDAGNFNFGYDIGRADGSRDSRQERGDIYGNVVGSYSLIDADGRSRIVDYTAGENGFQAVVRTNEHGTANQSPAYVSINSDAPRTSYASRSYAPAPAQAPAPAPAPAAPVRRHYNRPYYRPYRSTHYNHDNYNPYNHRSQGYTDHSHHNYNYDYPYYH